MIIRDHISTNSNSKVDIDLSDADPEACNIQHVVLCYWKAFNHCHKELHLRCARGLGIASVGYSLHLELLGYFIGSKV